MLCVMVMPPTMCQVIWNALKCERVFFGRLFLLWLYSCGLRCIAMGLGHPCSMRFTLVPPVIGLGRGTACFTVRLRVACLKPQVRLRAAHRTSPVA